MVNDKFYSTVVQGSIGVAAIIAIIVLAITGTGDAATFGILGAIAIGATNAIAGFTNPARKEEDTKAV